MPVHVVYREIGENVRGFVIDTPGRSVLVLDPSLTRTEQVALATELLEEGEWAEFAAALSA